MRLRWLLVLVLLAAPAALRAQASGTSILRGRVLDDVGTGLPGVVVRLSSSTAPVGAPTTLTDIEGHYRFVNLSPGRDYSVTASLPDYASIVAGPIELRPGRETRLDLELKRSSELEEIVRVEARGEIVETSSTTTSTTFNAELIEGVPLVGRSFSDLLTLAPGVTDTDGDGNPNVRGARETGMQLRLDGSNATNPLTGQLGQSVNLESVEELEVITGGATAEYGRADGGFANVITKSGGNETSGSLKLFYRSNYLDGTGAGPKDHAAVEFTDMNLYGTLGGALVKDHLWYFLALERLDEEEPVVFDVVTTGRFRSATTQEVQLRSLEGWRNFAKVTWQASPRHKVALQINQDPLESLGNNIGPYIDPESDYLLATGGTLPQITWTAVVSPQLLMQVVGSRLDLRSDTEPVSDHYRNVELVIRPDATGNLQVELPCLTINCQGDAGIRRTHFTPLGGPLGSLTPPQEVGAYNVASDVDLERSTLRSDLSYTLEEVAGQHGIKAGFQYEIERYEEDLTQNPIMTDRTCEFPRRDPPCDTGVPPGFRIGTLNLQAYDNTPLPLTADGFNVGAYAQDAWKPRPNLTINLGLRLDIEEIETSGFTFFDPAAEAREVLERYNIVCEAAGSGCQNQTPGRLNAHLPGIFAPPPGSPALRFDLNEDGQLDLNGEEGRLIYEPFTHPEDRLPDSFVIENTNLAPRLSVSWDPWADGKTKAFASWGRYYDRLFLGSVVTDQRPTWFVAQWDLKVLDQANPGDLSKPVSPSISLPQTDRDLRTPYTLEFTAGFEREIAPEWAASLTYIHRKGEDLLQDVDVNHITCEGFDETFGVSPYEVCGDGGHLEIDRFGAQQTTSFGQVVVITPNGAPDLYNLNPSFNQVMRVGNFNASRYVAWEAVLRKRLHRNWQMQVAYTWSRAEGEAESFDSLQGNDPAVSDKVAGYLSYDQRHILKFQSVSHLPHDILLGTTVQWASGLPYSLITNVEDFDDQGLLTPQRVFSLTGEKNDHRNESYFLLDGRIEKRFNVQKMQAAAFLACENLLNEHDVVIQEADRVRGVILESERRFGRRFEIGASILF